MHYKVLGFDCEWVTVGGTRRPIALLQLSSQQGLCALFRLCCLQHIPQCLRGLLEDKALLKVGVAPRDDAMKLANDFGVAVAGTFDLRFLADPTGHKALGLAKLSKSVLNVDLDKHWRLVCSDWEAKELNEKQLLYAANDSLVAVEIFKNLSKIMAKKFVNWSIKDPLPILNLHLEPLIDVHFKEGLFDKLMNTRQSKTLPLKGDSIKGSNDGKPTKMQIRGITTRSRMLYDNCRLLAPDDELLCTIDRKKAHWYLKQQLGQLTELEPLTVRLNFEPAGRGVGDEGRYYQTFKQNRCVVCGTREAYIRKNVIPREYRKHFPVVMKSHTSHDVLLLCPQCHQKSNLLDIQLRSYFAQTCDAPLKHETRKKSTAEIELRQLKSAARGLLYNGDRIPVVRKEELKQILYKYYTKSEITQDLLEKVANMDINVKNESHCQHGEKVVRMYKTKFNGLRNLEEIWRSNFLFGMEPKFLPSFWSIKHNANR